MRMKSAPLIVLVLGLGATACGDSNSGMGVAAPTTPTATSAPAAQAQYRVTFRAIWSQASHPNRFPSSPHFSPLVGVSHSASVRFWQAGAIASTGIEQMAELGATSPLDSLIRTALDAGQAQSLVLGGGINPAPGETSLELTATRDSPT
jgi:hypothetical protein